MDSLPDLWDLLPHHIGLIVSILFFVFALIKFLGRSASRASEDVPGDYDRIKVEAEAARTKAENAVMNRYAKHFPEKKP
jgi:hypothetical protein